MGGCQGILIVSQAWLSGREKDELVWDENKNTVPGRKCQGRGQEIPEWRTNSTLIRTSVFSFSTENLFFPLLSPRSIPPSHNNSVILPSYIISLTPSHPSSLELSFCFHQGGIWWVRFVCLFTCVLISRITYKVMCGLCDPYNNSWPRDYGTGDQMLGETPIWIWIQRCCFNCTLHWVLKLLVKYWWPFPGLIQHLLTI